MRSGWGASAAALRELVEEFSRNTGLAAQTLFRRVPADIPLDRATCLYRVAQESLRNVVKHAGAARVLVRLAGRRGGVGLCVQDDGCGMHGESRLAEPQQMGLGLTSMAERVAILQGTFCVEARRGGGTEVHAWLPLAEAGTKDGAHPVPGGAQGADFTAVRESALQSLAAQPEGT